MKIAYTAFSNEEHYINNLELLKSAWNRVGYEFQYSLLLMPNEKKPSNLPIAPYSVETLFEVEDKKSLKFLAYVQSARFRLASRFKCDDIVLVTDADILPISISHFQCTDGFDGVLHLNANAYYTHLGFRYPACYYVMSSRDWYKYLNPDKLEFNDWLYKSVLPIEYGVDEYVVFNSLRKVPIVKRLINKDERVHINNYKKILETRDLRSQVKDFHFHYFADSNQIKEIYNKLIGDINV